MTAPDACCLKPGDVVVYHQTRRGGYGFQRAIRATFVRIGKSGVVIEVETRSGGRRISVNCRNLHLPRTT